MSPDPKGRAIWIAKAGPASSLAMIDIDVPDPAAGEVIIAVEAAGVAFADITMRRGLYPDVKLPVSPGYDVVGRIAAVGAGVDRFREGDRVAAIVVTGGYASHVRAKAQWMVPAPANVAAENVVAAALNYVTAYQLLTRCAQVERGDAILVHGAAGGVGTALLDLARLLGLAAMGTASRGKHNLVRQLGATPIDYAREDFVEIARASGGVQAVFDHIGGAHLNRSMRAIRPTGVVVSYGGYALFRNGRLSPLGLAKALTSRLGLDPLGMLTNSSSLVGYTINAHRDSRNRAFREDFSAVMALLVAGDIKPTIDSVMPLEKAGEAHQRLETAQASGKIVLQVS